MKVCASFGLRKSYSPDVFGEVRMDVFGKLPPKLGKNTIITLCDNGTDVIPDGFSGYADVGYYETETKCKKIISYHDFEKTPNAKTIAKILTRYDCDIAKGAFAVDSFEDLHSIHSSSKLVGKKHVILGMGENGTVTRIRQKLLKNEFTYGYVGKPTAEGQLEYEVLNNLGDECKIVGIAGYPLNHSLSPKMQNCAIKKEKINAIYLKFQSPSLKNVGEVIKEYDILGMNVTTPFKEKITEKMDSLSEISETLGAANTIVNEKGKLRGYNTDVAGVDYALSGHSAKGKKALVLGTGGAAKAAIMALQNRKCRVSVAGRDAKKVNALSKSFGTEKYAEPFGKYEILINCTPIGLVEGKYPAEIELREKQLVIDAVYGRKTPLLAKAEKCGCVTEDGKKMLVGQGAESFKLWFGKSTCRKSMLRSIS